MTGSPRSLAVALAVAIALAGPLGLHERVAAADPADAAEARDLFERGTTALRSGRVAEARDLFRRSFALLPTSPTAFNLAVSLRGTGETSEALSLFAALLDGRYGELSDDHRREVEDLRRQVDQDLATLEVRDRGETALTVRVTRTDGRPVAAQAARFSVEPGARSSVRLDAGAHDLRATAAGNLAADGHVELDRGGRFLWEPSLLEERAASDSAAAGTARPARPSGGATTWIWIAGGAALLAIAGAVTFLAVRETTRDPVSDDVFGIVEALTVRP